MTHSTHAGLRIALSGLPELRAQALAPLLGGLPGVAAVQSVAASGDLSTDLVRAGADVVVCELPEYEVNRQWDAVLDHRPTFVNVVEGGQQVRIYALRSVRTAVDDVGSVALVAAILRALETESEPRPD